MKELISVIIIIVILSTALYFAYTAVKDLPPSAVPAGSLFFGSAVAPEPKSADTETAAPSPQARSVPAGAQEYRNRAYGFSLFYPAELSVAERAEGAAAATVTFQNVETARGFQIFIVPYGEAQVSEERFKEDVPSGVRRDSTDITVDGAAGAAFDSADAELGETREIWFIRGGFLYEVTTLKPLGQWLEQILRSWQWEKR